MPTKSLGLGLSSRATLKDLIALTAPHAQNLTCLATLNTKAPLAQQLADHLALPLKLYPAEHLSSIRSSVSEASALAALGPRATLQTPKQTGRFCTCAVAICHD